MRNWEVWWALGILLCKTTAGADPKEVRCSATTSVDGLEEERLNAEILERLPPQGPLSKWKRLLNAGSPRLLDDVKRTLPNSAALFFSHRNRPLEVEIVDVPPTLATPQNGTTFPTVSHRFTLPVTIGQGFFQQPILLHRSLPQAPSHLTVPLDLTIALDPGAFVLNATGDVVKPILLLEEIRGAVRPADNAIDYESSNLCHWLFPSSQHQTHTVNELYMPHIETRFRDRKKLPRTLRRRIAAAIEMKSQGSSVDLPNGVNSSRDKDEFTLLLLSIGTAGPPDALISTSDKFTFNVTLQSRPPLTSKNQKESSIPLIAAAAINYPPASPPTEPFPAACQRLSGRHSLTKMHFDIRPPLGVVSHDFVLRDHASNHVTALMSDKHIMSFGLEVLTPIKPITLIERSQSGNGAASRLVCCLRQPPFEREAEGALPDLPQEADTNVLRENVAVFAGPFAARSLLELSRLIPDSGDEHCPKEREVCYDLSEVYRHVARKQSIFSAVGVSLHVLVVPSAELAVAQRIRFTFRVEHGPAEAANATFAEGSERNGAKEIAERTTSTSTSAGMAIFEGFCAVVSIVFFLELLCALRYAGRLRGNSTTPNRSLFSPPSSLWLREVDPGVNGPALSGRDLTNGGSIVDQVGTQSAGQEPSNLFSHSAVDSIVGHGEKRALLRSDMWQSV